MALKLAVLATLLIAGSVVPMAHSQLGGLIGPLLGLLQVQGILYCTPNGNIGAGGVATPVFPNAAVQLQCNGNVVSTSATSNSGVFSMFLNPLNFALSRLLSACKLVANTPLATCNATLPSVGRLESTLQLAGNTLFGSLNVVNLVPTGFECKANVN